MRTSDFNFSFPSDFIAYYPTKERDESRLMVIHRKKNSIEHRLFKDLYEYFENGDTIILNNTKVFPARLFGNKEKTEAKIEVFLLRELDPIDRIWDVLVDPARKVRVGNKLNFGNGLTGEVIDNTTSRGRILQLHFCGSHEGLIKKIKELGKTPLPKYIQRSPEKSDEQRYQTIYAKKEGSVAAPTAGLHFSKHLLKKLEIKGINLVEITLHLGLGSFLPVEVEDISKHKMDSEKCFITKDVCNIVNQTIKQKKRICAVGTSSMRAIESSVSSSKNLNHFSGWTNKFIFPPYNFNIANSMITNFHMPKSTLLMMTVAFAGYDLIMKAYQIAIEKKYRFYSYGDAMLIL
ncbi:MAG: tRNA preQ1(34) S-adenosylmethionine ribosyltransferase-isomerase QueA [Flavobacteriales bacterium]|jgi:S-adenosylmethionine:tRNA ribosyltransferase-isomerase|uniref:tRNA preQ1(34) S-adenosylmethionine ribosyltransferase-isomerase QueA n=1 Tax=Blattabacterium sp. (Mastotermes darwiniensis) TaxID=39768 RepID=UPI000231DE35|nr:tRNA preQ1(34) S-adenosylmethionine ribosyltransferase-isomerase QueA [Blattabacterium sp. (Mastotermes darwiniensis)]AER40617.1 S-adenosylmethionine:tRNA ribosyltransferase-isomerase [Blattabacterium sp. (Mastotermes darwiniensis) str. MADAR]MDR1804742.1 tRNA preQ1(34) S-adenosylmethionine ribosyltransferase-isomerase QueA [Flavobacteriales bacterium]